MNSHTYGVVIENLQAHVLPEFFDRDFAREAVIGVIEADDLGDQTFDERRSLGSGWPAKSSFAARRSRQSAHHHLEMICVS
jgi:hypothetical protein